MEGKYIPINKGNYSMETPEREALFEKHRAEGWKEEYRDHRSKWVDYAKNQYVSEYPQLVDIELASICNLKCPMCYTITEHFKEKVNTKLMDFELFKKIIDEIGGKVPAIRLSLRGESTLHPKFIECIRYAKEKGIREVSTLTNGSKLKEAYFTKMLDAGIDWITISVDGVGEVYESIRKPIKFEQIFNNITTINRIKRERNVTKPVIKIQSVWPAIREDPESYYNLFAPHVDMVAYNPLIDYLGKDEDILYEENFSCPQLYQRLVVGADGLVMMCSNDDENAHPVGDANFQSISQIWHGDKLDAVREKHKQKNGFCDIAICKKCYLPRTTENNETASVNGRSFEVKNYVNRKQTIGQ